MNLKICGDGVDITDAMRARANEVGLQLAAYSDRVTHVRVLYRVEPHRAKEEQQQAQLTINVAGRKQPIEVKKTGPCAYDALLAACKMGIQQIDTHKQRSQVQREEFVRVREPRRTERQMT